MWHWEGTGACLAWTEVGKLRVAFERQEAALCPRRSQRKGSR